jgi:hypothetical protein
MKRLAVMAAAALALTACGGGAFDEGTAWGLCKQRVEAQLRAPATAQFPSPDDMRWTKNIRTYKFPAAYVDSENGFGAPVRTYFECTVMQRSEGSSDADVTVSF